MRRKAAKRMKSPSCLDDATAHLVIDSSVVINLVATGYAEEILASIPNRAVAVEEVVMEISRGHKKGKPGADIFNKLVESGHLIEVSLDPVALEHFGELSSGPAASTLGSGEAATIAHAAVNNGMPIIDERKATRVCSEKYPDITIACTTDIFSHPDVQKALGRNKLSAAVENALGKARMSVLHDHHREWITRLIGPEKASSYSGLSKHAHRYK